MLFGEMNSPEVFVGGKSFQSAEMTYMGGITVLYRRENRTSPGCRG